MRNGHEHFCTCWVYLITIPIFAGKIPEHTGHKKKIIITITITIIIIIIIIIITIIIMSKQPKIYYTSRLKFVLLLQTTNGIFRDKRLKIRVRLINTGGPSYARSFYLRFRLFAVYKLLFLRTSTLFLTTSLIFLFTVS
jgi:hypothetical protein